MSQENPINTDDGEHEETEIQVQEAGWDINKIMMST